MWKGINLLKSSRMINFPFKVRSIGSTQMEFAHDLMRVFRTDHVEFCIRISSKEKFAHDQINGIRYRTRFPHLIVKMPFAQHCYQMKEPRNAVDFSYGESAEARPAPGISVHGIYHDSESRPDASPTAGIDGAFTGIQYRRPH